MRMQLAEWRVRHWIEEAQRGNTASRDELLRTHMGLIIYVATRFHRSGHFTELGDLVQQGCVGLLRAIEKFDLNRQVDNKPVQFASYARFWIEHFMRREIDSHGRTIALPVNIQACLRRAARENQALPAGQAGAPSFAEATLSLDILMDENHVVSIAWARKLAIEEPEQDCSGAAVESLLTALLPRERFLIEQRHGLNTGEGPKPLHEVAKVLGISRQRAGQIERRAIERMRQQKRPIGL